MPFSFEERNKQLLEKRVQKIKELKANEEKKIKAEFHARPVPQNLKTPVFSQKPSKIPNSVPLIKKPKFVHTISFEERNQQLLKKKVENIKQKREEDNSRIFKANPVPEFKPVTVRGTAKDKMMKKSQENIAVKSNHAKPETSAPLKKPKTIPFVPIKKTNALTEKKNKENQENILSNSKGAIPKILEPKQKLSTKTASILTELNTDKRAKERQEFDCKLKQKEQEEKDFLEKEERDRIAKEKSDKAALRKMAEPKARPMPVYKPLVIMKSSKPLTDAQSPAWSRKHFNLNHN